MCRDAWQEILLCDVQSHHLAMAHMLAEHFPVSDMEKVVQGLVRIHVLDSTAVAATAVQNFKRWTEHDVLPNSVAHDVCTTL